MTMGKGEGVKEGERRRRCNKDREKTGERRGEIKTKR